MYGLRSGRRARGEISRRTSNTGGSVGVAGVSRSIGSSASSQGGNNANDDTGRNVEGNAERKVNEVSSSSVSSTGASANIGNDSNVGAGNNGNRQSNTNTAQEDVQRDSNHNVGVNHNSNAESDFKSHNHTPHSEIANPSSATRASTTTHSAPTTNNIYDPYISFTSSGFSSGGSPNMSLTPGNQYGGWMSQTDTQRQHRNDEDMQRQYLQRWCQANSPFLSMIKNLTGVGEFGLSSNQGVGSQPSTANRVTITEPNGMGDTSARHAQTHISNSSTPLNPSVGLRQVIIKEGNPNPAEIANLRSYYGPNEEQYYTGGEDFLYQFNAATALTFKMPSQKIAAFRTKMAGPALTWYKRLTVLQTATWEKLVEAFLQYSVRVGYGEDYQTQLSRCVQKEGELCDTFYARLLDIQDRANTAALMAAPPQIRESIQDCKAKQQQALVTYQESTTVENEEQDNNSGQENKRQRGPWKRFWGPGTPGYSGCHRCKSKEHYERDCPLLLPEVNQEEKSA